MISSPSLQLPLLLHSEEWWPYWCQCRRHKLSSLGVRHNIRTHAINWIVVIALPIISLLPKEFKTESRLRRRRGSYRRGTPRGPSGGPPRGTSGGPPRGLSRGPPRVMIEAASFTLDGVGLIVVDEVLSSNVTTQAGINPRLARFGGMIDGRRREASAAQRGGGNCDDKQSHRFQPNL